MNLHVWAAKNGQTRTGSVQDGEVSEAGEHLKTLQDLGLLNSYQGENFSSARHKKVEVMKKKKKPYINPEQKCFVWPLCD